MSPDSRRIRGDAVGLEAVLDLARACACSAGYDLRIVFDFVKNANQTEAGIFLLEIGTHEEVY